MRLTIWSRRSTKVGLHRIFPKRWSALGTSGAFDSTLCAGCSQLSKTAPSRIAATARAAKGGRHTGRDERTATLALWSAIVAGPWSVQVLLLLCDGSVGHSGAVDSHIVVATCGDRSARNREVDVVVVDNVAGNADKPAGSRERRIVA